MDVVTFGESMALLKGDSANGIEYAARMDISFGGAESNVAIGVSRLGHRAGWFGRLGNDPLGRSILKSIRGEGVDVSRAVLSDDGPTGLMVRETVRGKTSLYYYRQYSAMSRMAPVNLDPEYIAGARILHLTGITPALSDSCRETVIEAIRAAKRSGVKICFDPNLRLKLWSIEQAADVLLSLAEEADYFLPGLDELKLLYRTDDFDTIVSELNKLSALSVVKGGEGVTYLIENGTVREIPFFKAASVVDTVGAGDGFCAGFLSGLLQELDSSDAVALGNLVGSLVVQAEGDWESIPTRAEVDAVLQGTSHIER
ncbi:sugar kinase [Paenibacillus oenotherae]|uniref:Sugar kinase n=1 Tax=Paenibacillus oenotherae TaxID=1435645 RepID=A0ABS7DBJ2_9BACL|nr:sugar kinase [Paenibacillus oenotherae]MBW7477266.1 sugar kinase [Paenibacillus oenotherae]